MLERKWRLAMQSAKGKLRLWIGMAILVAGVTGFGAKAAWPRGGQNPGGPLSSQSGGQNPVGTPKAPFPTTPAAIDGPMGPLEDGDRSRLDAQHQKMLTDERHKKLLEDTDKLLQLATELKADVDKATKNEMSLAVIKKAAEIEKLSHDVKERMKN
jgi:hypothetical protein